MRWTSCLADMGHAAIADHQGGHGAFVALWRLLTRPGPDFQEASFDELAVCICRDGLSESISEASCRGPAEDLVSTSFLAVSALNAFACTLLKVAKPQSVTPWSCSFCSCSCLAAGLQ
ncbi:hypothetical protein WJX74_000752 [Apatococcus lobatus]|uniref:Uncharacterized protein n=1 Tax=Apatococcus lobatus TaxID=904363 RepID=A0AAW1R100_9CHLO